MGELGRDKLGYKNIVDEFIRYLDKLINSGVFRKSKNSQKILRFYKKSFLENNYEFISEKIIAFEVFKKDLQYDPTVDSFIRVVFYRFRNNLSEYYLDEGMDDEIELYIPKGAYVPYFRKRMMGAGITTELPFMLSKTELHERVIFSLRTLFMTTLNRNDLKLILEYHQSLDGKRRTPFIEAIGYEMKLFRMVMFLEDIGESIEDLDRDTTRLLDENPHEDHAYVACIMVSIKMGDVRRMKELAETLYRNTTQNLYKGIACMSHSLIDPDSTKMEELEKVLQLHENLSFFWHLPKLITYLRKNEMYKAITEAFEINRFKSLFSEILFVVIKNKLKKLSVEDEQFVSQNKQYFTESYLKNFIFELAADFAIE